MPGTRTGHHHAVDTFEPDDEPIDDLLLDHVDTGPTLAELFEMTDPPPTTSLELGEWWL
jgi:hypothetical protein